jgi:membrane associated rhomboid family serine protease
LGIILFISIFSSLSGNVDFAGHIGGLLGGYLCGLAIFPGIRPKPKNFIIIGTLGLGIYIMTMLLLVYL